ncbi:MAG TPA: caspase family protein [Roseomonas sp.]
MRALLACLAALLFAVGAAQAQEPPQAPFLRIEAAAHTAPVARLATDAGGRLLASVSDDKTLRLWTLPDGLPRGVLRPPIGDGAEGELYAVALSPDGNRAYAAGFTGQEWDRQFSVYLFDTNTTRMTGVLRGLPAPVQHLAVSADGGLLAAALGGRAGIRVWDARNGRPVFEDTQFAGPARMIAFAPDGRVAATSADGRVRVYSPQGRKLAERVPAQGARPYGLAWSPDGSLLAIGFEDRLRVDVLAASDLHSVFTPDVTGLTGEGLPAVTWASDGRGGVQLHAAGYARIARPPTPASAGSARPAPTPLASSEGRGILVDSAAAAMAGAPPVPLEFVIRRWADFGLGPYTDIAAARDAIAHLLPLPGGGIAYAAADPGWGRIAPDGTLAVAPQPPGADFRATGVGIALSPDGTQLRFALRANAPNLIFDAMTGRLSAGDGEGFVTARTNGRLSLADYRNTNRPRLGQTPLRLGEGEISRSGALLDGDRGVLLGTDTHLRLFDASGRLVDSAVLPGAAWGVAVSGNTAVVALGDGTMRWFRIEPRLSEQAAVFFHAPTLRWVAWTPEGLFEHAPNGGQELVGVHLNGNRSQTPEWASFQQAYRALHAPAALRARIAGDNALAQERLAQLGDVRARIGRLPLLAPGAACAVTDSGCQPVTWDGGALPEGARALRLSFITTDRGLGLGPLDILVNDRIAARAQPGAGQAEIEVPLDPGPNRIASRLYAEDRTLFAEGPSLMLRRPGEPEPPASAGRLIVLAIGVNQYSVQAMNLRYAVPDARVIADTLRTAGAGVFRDVQTTVLIDRDATRAGILAAMDRAAATVQPTDTFILYIAGHGIRTEPDQRFLFLPSDVRDVSSMEALRRQGIDDSTLVAALARIRARDAFLLLDTCHAGQLTMDQLSALGNETGRFLLAASSSVQEALDSYDDRNGVFAYAFREGLMGRAAADGDGRISALALGEWVMRRVPQLAAEKNHRQDAVFRTAQRDLRSFPLGQVTR